MLRKYVYCSNILSMLAVWIFKTSRVSFTKLGVKIRTMSTGISINNSMVVYPIGIIKNSVSGHFSSSDMKILKDQGAQTTARVVSVAYRLYIYIYIYIYICIYEQETSVCMCCVVKIKQKTQRLFWRIFVFF